VSWKLLLILNENEQLEFIGKSETGTTGQKEVSRYNIVNIKKQVTCKAEYHEGMQISGYMQTNCFVVQYDNTGSEMLRKSV